VNSHGLSEVDAIINDFARAERIIPEIPSGTATATLSLTYSCEEQVEAKRE